jgi:hypothetical protein
MALGFKPDLLLDDQDPSKNPNQLKDLMAAPFRGVEGAVKSVYNLADFALGDTLPDYDNRFLGQSETIAGSLVEGVTQFLVPFGAIAKGAKAASKIGRFGKQFTTVNKKGKDVLNWKGVLAAESATDFVAFEEQEARLSNLINTFPTLRNPITDFLESTDDEGVIEGRFKNSLEGLGLTGVATGLIAGLKAMKVNRTNGNLSADVAKKLKEKYGIELPEETVYDPNNIEIDGKRYAVNINLGGEFLRKNEAAFNQIRTFGEVDTYNVYSPALRAIEKAPAAMRPEKVTEILTKFGERGTAEELKWMNLQFDLLPKDAKGRVKTEQVKKMIENKQLETTLVEQPPKPEYANFRQPRPESPEGKNYREFTLEAPVDDFVLARDDLGEYNSHYEKVASDKGRTNLLHFRTTDRKLGNKTVLQIEELQSDFLQAVNKKRRKEKDFTGRVALEDSYISSGIRQILQLAAREGYDSVSFPTGVDIAGLYNTELDFIKLNAINEDGSRSFDVTKNEKTQTVIVKNNNELKEMFGKEASEDLLKKPEGWSQENYQVKVNAAPFMQQYDKKMPAALDRFAKSFGSKTRTEKVEFTRQYEQTPFDKQYIKNMGSSEILENGDLRFDSGQEQPILEIIDIFQDEGLMLYDKSLRKELDFNDSGVIDDFYDFLGTEEGVDEVEFLTNAINSGRLSKRFEVVLNGGRGKVPQDAHIIDINDSMKESVTKGVSLWGQKGSAKNTYGSTIKDPELRTALGLNEAETYNIVKAMAKEARADKNEVIETVSGKSVTTEFALNRLATNGSTPEVRKLSKALLKLHEGDTEFMRTDIEARFGNGAAGDYNPFDVTTGRGSIGLYTNRKGVFEGEIDADTVFSEGTLLHETIHAGVVTKIPVEISAVNRNLKGEDYLTTVAAYADDANQSEPLRKLLRTYLKAVDNAPDQFKNIRNALNDIDDYAQANGDSISEWYGLSNVDEFIAEAMSSPNFQNYLKGIEGEGGKNLFDEIISYLKELLGFDAKGTALEDVVTAYSDLVSKDKRRFRAVDYAPENVRRMFPTRSSKAFRQIHEQKRSAVVSDAFNEAKVDLGGLKRGGEAAVKGVAKSLGQVETANDLGELIAKTESAVESELSANPKLNPESLEKAGIAGAVNRFSEMTGTDKDFIMSEVNAASKDAGELRRIASRMYAVESLAIGQADTVYKLAADLEQKGPAVTEIDKAQLVGEVKKLMSITAAGSNLRRGFGQGLQSTQFKRSKITLNDIEIRNQEIVNEYMANNMGKQEFNQILQRILHAGDPNDVINNMLGVSKQARATDPNGFIEKAQNWYINSLLSGPRTFVKNAVGNMVAQTLLQVEAAVGGAFVDKAITRHVLKEFATLESFREGMNFFLKSYKLDQQMLDVGRSPLENTAKTERPTYFSDAAPEQTMRQAFNWFGDNIVNIPTKLLMSMDEVFKQSLFRQNAKLELTLKGMQLGIKNPDELAEYVARGMDTVLVQGERAFSNTGVIKYANQAVQKMDEEALAKGGKRLLPSERAAKIQEIIDQETAIRGDALKKYEDGGLGFENLNEIDNMSARSLEFARYGTFTNDAGKAAELAGAIVKTVPFMKFIFPFVRTPVNLLKFSFDRAFFAAPEMSRQVLANMPDMPMIKDTQRKLRQELNSRNPVEKARAAGKLATASMINATLLYMILSNREFITSGGPKDTAQLRTLEQSGWQRYSFRVGDKYFSYSGLDPFGTHFGVLADIVDQFDEAGEINSTVAEQVFAAATISMTRNITDKSYLAGLQLISDALSDPDRKMQKLFTNLSGGFVPNILYQGQSLGGDTTTREVRNLGDAILKKLPNGNDILDPKRNLLGEPIIAENYPIVGPFNPSRVSTRKGDAVFEELARLEHGFTNPKTKLHRLIDMTEYKNDKNQSAYDRQLEMLGEIKLRGKTLRQSLEKVIKDKRYQKLSTISEGGVKSPRIQILNKIISRYRRVAFAQMLEEFPDVKAKYMQIRQANVAGKAGASEDVITNLLNLNE